MAKGLFEITGHESGHILWPDGKCGIYHWGNGTVEGLPLLPPWISGPECGPKVYGPNEVIGVPSSMLIAWRVKTPEEAITHMRGHEISLGEKPSKRGFRSWRVSNGDMTVVVTVNVFWA